MTTPVTASRRFVAALAAFMILAPLAPSIVSAAPGLTPGGTATIASDSTELVRVEPGFGSAVASEAAPGTLTTVIDGPYYDSEGLEWYQVDGGFLPSWALASNDYIEASQDVAADDASTQSWDESADGAPVEETWIEPVAEDVPADETWVEPVAEEAPVDETWVEPVAEEIQVYDPAAVVGTAWIAGTNGDGAVCRSDASPDSGELGTLWDGDRIDVLGDPVGEWQPVSCSGQAGFVHASFIAWEQPDSVSRNASGADGQDNRDTVEAAPLPASETAESEQKGRRGGGRGDGASAGNDGSSNNGATSEGQAIVDFAMQYVGFPYVYAGEGPHAFDCSGFTMYVAREVLGMDITHDMFVQVGLGQSVGRNELQPGDLVFFQNTFQDGLSHAGIYIGNGQFVHAENENTGVVVSDIDSDYYGSRWYGAARLT